MLLKESFMKTCLNKMQWFSSLLVTDDNADGQYSGFKEVPPQTSTQLWAG